MSPRAGPLLISSSQESQNAPLQWQGLKTGGIVATTTKYGGKSTPHILLFRAELPLSFHSLVWIRPIVDRNSKASNWEHFIVIVLDGIFEKLDDVVTAVSEKACHLKQTLRSAVCFWFL